MNSIFIFLLGTFFGSFFYTLSLRYINGFMAENKYRALFGFSMCPACGKRIRLPYLIPLAGYLLSGGKCAECGVSISKKYPLIEILYGVFALAVYYRFGSGIYAAIIYLIIGTSVSISVIDIKILTVPNSLIVVFVLLSVYPVVLNSSVKDPLYGFILMGMFFVIVLLIFPGSFGGGDVKFASAIGILLGFELSIVALEGALITGSLAGIIYAVMSGKGFKIKFPFAPFLTAGLFVSLIYGRDILYIYYRIFF